MAELTAKEKQRCAELVAQRPHDPRDDDFDTINFQRKAWEAGKFDAMRHLSRMLHDVKARQNPHKYFDKYDAEEMDEYLNKQSEFGAKYWLVTVSLDFKKDTKGKGDLWNKVLKKVLNFCGLDNVHSYVFSFEYGGKTGNAHVHIVFDTGTVQWFKCRIIAALTRQKDPLVKASNFIDVRFIKSCNIAIAIQYIAKDLFFLDAKGWVYKEQKDYQTLIVNFQKKLKLPKWYKGNYTPLIKSKKVIEPEVEEEEEEPDNSDGETIQEEDEEDVSEEEFSQESGEESGEVSDSG